MLSCGYCLLSCIIYLRVCDVQGVGRIAHW